MQGGKEKTVSVCTGLTSDFFTGVRKKLQRTTRERVGLCPARNINQKNLEVTARGKSGNLII